MQIILSILMLILVVAGIIFLPVIGFIFTVLATLGFIGFLCFVFAGEYIAERKKSTKEKEKLWWK